jgi:hypothetical protein
MHNRNGFARRQAGFGAHRNDAGRSDEPRHAVACHGDICHQMNVHAEPLHLKMNRVPRAGGYEMNKRVLHGIVRLALNVLYPVAWAVDDAGGCLKRCAGRSWSTTALGEIGG